MIKLKPSELLLAVSFFFSGVAALTYQICWNRALYGAIGVDMDSVTIIVSCFMLGIGIGGALGGVFADAYPNGRLRGYILIEVALSVYGMLSLGIIQSVSNLTLLGGLLGVILTATVTFLVLLIPTVLMGMTLPLLSLAFQQRVGNMGDAVGRLYFANTLGAAAGAFMVPHYVFPVLDLQQSCWLAAGLNLTVAGLATWAVRSSSEQKKI
jgi:predicted membrane-bound spermidine synthase